MLEINGLTQLLSLLREKPVVVVAFYADWCGPCQQVKPLYAAMSELYRGNNNVIFCRCNADRNSDCTSQFNVRSLPTLSLWVAGELRTSIVGGNLGELQLAIDRALETYRSSPAATRTGGQARSDGGAAVKNSNLATMMESLAKAVCAGTASPVAVSEACGAVCAVLEGDTTTGPFGVALLPYFASTGFNAAAVDALFAYMAGRPEPRCRDGVCIVNHMLSYLIEFFLSTTLDQTVELKLLRQTLYAIVSCKSVLEIFVHSHLFYNDLLATGLQLEHNTVLGAMLGVCNQSRNHRIAPPFSRRLEWEQLVKMFPSSGVDHSKKISELQFHMQASCAENTRIIMTLLQSKISREPTLRFLGAALRLNSGYTKTIHHDMPLSSRYFMTQLNDVIIEAALPLFGKNYDPSTIPSYYVLEDPSDFTVVNFGDDVERITHYDGNFPLPKFPEDHDSFKPSVHLFFLAARSIMLSAAVLIGAHETAERDARHPQLPPEQKAIFLAEKSFIEGLLCSESLGRKRVRVLNGIAAWLVRLMNADPEGTLSKEPPKEWKYLPQQLVDIVICGVDLAPLDYFDVENIVSLMLILMGNTIYFPKPHTHALFPSFLTRLMQNEETRRALTSHRWFTQHIIRGCVMCYIAVEKSTYEKVTVRYMLSHCIKSFLVFDSLCQSVREEFEADGTILERFSHMVTADVNEAVDQLIETLTKMNRLAKEGADLSQDALAQRNNNTNNNDANNRGGRGGFDNSYGNMGGAANEEEDTDAEDDGGDSPLTYHQLGLGLRQHILLFETSITLFTQLAISFSKGVAQNMVAQQISQMLARSLVSFAGAESKNLKIEHPERYNFRPREILGRLVDCLAQFRRFQNFMRSLCNCGIPLKDILGAMHTVADRMLVDEHLVWKLKEMAATLEALSQEVHEDEALWDEAPEFALDALLSTPLLHPVALPADVKDLSGLVYVNEDTIHHVLLSESKHPFTKEYLDENMVKEFNAREDVAEARQKLQERIAEWLEEAKSVRQNTGRVN